MLPADHNRTQGDHDGGLKFNRGYQRSAQQAWMKGIQNGGMRSLGDASLFVVAVVVSTTETEKQALAAASTSTIF